MSEVIFNMENLIEKTDIILDDDNISAREKAATCINIDYPNCSYKNTGILSCNYCGWYKRED